MPPFLYAGAGARLVHPACKESAVRASANDASAKTSAWHDAALKLAWQASMARDVARACGSVGILHQKDGFGKSQLGAPVRPEEA